MVYRSTYVLDNYDDIGITTYDDGNAYSSWGYRDKDNNQGTKVQYSKKIDVTYFVVIAAPEAEYKRLWIISAFLSNKKDSSVTQVSNDSILDRTSDNAHASPDLSNDRVQQSNDDVKYSTTVLE